MAATTTLPINIPRLDFDIVQGQYLRFPITYAVSGVADTLDGKEIHLEIKSQDKQVRLDYLTSINGRIEKDGPNKMWLVFPEPISNSWTLKLAETKFDYGLKLVFGEISENILWGMVTVKRRRVE